MSGGYSTEISWKGEEPEWDAFLAETPGSDHRQSSLWGRVKAQLGWRAMRLVIKRKGEIVGGAQLMVRSLPFLGAISFLPRGPVFALDYPELTELAINKICQSARANRILYLVMQPASNNEDLTDRLLQHGFRPAEHEYEPAPAATILIDLAKDHESILARMKAKTRYNVRLAERNGIRVREGTERDISTFYRLLNVTGQRQGFTPEPEYYYHEMWRILYPRGYIRLLFAENKNVPVSASLLITFGDTVVYKRGAWSGLHGKHKPNEFLHWSAIRWAKSVGYRYYDFDGIGPELAKKLLNGEPVPEELLSGGVNRFKLGFGGRIITLSPAYEYIRDPILRWAKCKVFPTGSNSLLLSKFYHLVKK